MKPHTARQFWSQKSNRQDQINNKLQPLLQTVRQRNIHSYFQMSQKCDSDAIQSQRMVFNPQITKINKLYSTIQSKKSNRANSPELLFPSSQKKILVKYNQISNDIKQGIPLQLVKPYSKIKKHLISSIDFDQIERNLYKKRQNVTRYQAFYQKIIKKNSQPNRKKQLPTTVKVMVEINNDTIELLPQKIKTKKRFWIKSLGKKQRILTNRDNIIEGKSIPSMRTTR